MGPAASTTSVRSALGTLRRGLRRVSGELPLVLGKLEECGGIAPRHARHHRIVGCHVMLSPGTKQRIARRLRIGRVTQKEPAGDAAGALTLDPRA